MREKLGRGRKAKGKEIRGEGRGSKLERRGEGEAIKTSYKTMSQVQL